MMDVLKQLSIFFICTVYVIVCYAEEDLALKKPEIYSLHIFSDIKYRFATTKVTSRVKNVHKSSSEAIFDVTLPNEAFITNLTLKIEGKIVVGEIKEKEVARKQYLAAQQRGESAAYIGTQNRETNKFSLAVTVAPESKISFNLTYQELLKRKSSQYEQVIYIDPGQPVDDMDITVAILESREITLLRVPPLKNDIGDSLADLSTLTVISQPTPKTANIKFIPTVDQQLAQAESGMAGQFVVQYDVERDMDAGDVLIVNGYFVHFFAPEGLKPIPYNVLFILDVSGSMYGKKLSQLKQAMLSIIKQLGNGDMMNIMTFASTTNFWQNEMMNVMDEDVIEEAFNFVNSLTATGATNIELAIKDGLKFLNDDTLVNSTVRSPVIVFLTDGEATVGMTDKNTILGNVHRFNENGIPIFSLGFGEYADYELVKKIALQNNGFGRKIYEASDAALQIVGFYHEIAVTLLNNITFEYLDKPVENVTKHIYANYFNGSEMVVCGRYSQSSDILNETENSMSLKVSANTYSGMNIVLSGGLENIIPIDDDNLTKSGDYEEITEKMWAYLTIKQLLDKKLAADDTEAIERYTKEVLALSLRHGFVTPLTSMVVTMPTELNDFQVRKPGVSRSERRGKADTKQQSGLQMRTQYQAMPMSYGRSFNMQPTFSDQGRLPAIAVRPPVWKNSFYDAGGVSKSRRKPKRKSQNKEFMFPLIINGSQPLCLKMMTSRKHSSDVYLLHENSKKDIRVEMKLGRKRRQSIIKEVILISNTTRAIITSENILSQKIQNLQSLSGFDISFTKRHMVISTPDIRLTVLDLGSDELSLIVDVNPNSAFRGVGVLDQLMTTNVRFNGTRSSRNGREYGFFSINSKIVMLMKRQLDVKAYEDILTNCWSSKKKEKRFFNMAAAKSPQVP